MLNLGPDSWSLGGQSGLRGGFDYAYIVHPESLSVKSAVLRVLEMPFWAWVAGILRALALRMR